MNHKFDIHREDLYLYDDIKFKDRTLQRLTEIADAGMEEIACAQFGVPNVMSGLYIEKVWRYDDEMWKDYMDWARSVIKREEMKQRVRKIIDRITASCFGTDFKFRMQHDIEFENGRIFIQVVYNAPCTKTGETQEWHGRKWYLSKHMTDDEIVKTAYVAFEACVKHEIMEGFKVDGIILFNPHINFEELLAISHREVKREEMEADKMNPFNY